MTITSPAIIIGQYIVKKCNMTNKPITNKELQTIMYHIISQNEIIDKFVNEKWRTHLGTQYLPSVEKKFGIYTDYSITTFPTTSAFPYHVDKYNTHIELPENIKNILDMYMINYLKYKPEAFKYNAPKNHQRVYWTYPDGSIITGYFEYVPYINDNWQATHQYNITKACLLQKNEETKTPIKAYKSKVFGSYEAAEQFAQTNQP